VKPKVDYQDPQSPLFFETQSRVTHVYFNRPETLNPFDFELSERFSKLMGVLKKEPSDVVVLTGKGRAFSAGADLAFLEKCTQQSFDKTRLNLKKLYSNFLKVRELRQVSIAKVNGAVAGGGLGIVWACDLRAVLESARFAFNFVKLGISPGMGIVYLSSQILGEAKARELWLRGRTLTGLEVAKLGGATETAETLAELDTVTQSLVDECLSNGKLGMSYIKKELLHFERLREHVAFNCTHQAKCLKAPEALEGLRAMREKRAPHFGPKNP
jgi:2-(1,2-epoxy-1,2-dihydrophenyl)acetyl-CoA isomerase